MAQKISENHGAGQYRQGSAGGYGGTADVLGF